MGTKKFSKGEVLKTGWGIFKSNFSYLSVVALIGALILSPIYSVMGNPNSVSDPYSPWIFCFYLILPLFTLITIKLSLMLIDENKRMGFKDLRMSMYLILKFYLAMFLYFVIVLCGFILLIIPGIVWSIKYIFTPYYVVDLGLGPIESIKKSGEITKGQKWNLFLTGIIVTLLPEIIMFLLITLVLVPLLISGAPNTLISNIISFISGLFAWYVQIITAIVFALIYRKLTTIEEVFDNNAVPAPQDQNVQLIQ